MLLKLNKIRIMLVAVATQKFVSEVASDALHWSIKRTMLQWMGGSRSNHSEQFPPAVLNRANGTTVWELTLITAPRSNASGVASIRQYTCRYVARRCFMCSSHVWMDDVTHLWINDDGTDDHTHGCSSHFKSILFEMTFSYLGRERSLQLIYLFEIVLIHPSHAFC
ncbi:TFIID_30kDa domain-containing protein [Cephalotus follicularis]|uniref:TFIID_30kDa domain-containing protein n=1 Tax=Cephalotus follicularis TaxID=3775 RepID=A0A1Q3D6M2_CEPFO|nr:TFIID_30kDa domain-containing protein [Cephalotus follicularis]